MQLGAPGKFGKSSGKYLKIMAIRSRIKLTVTDFYCVSNVVWKPAIESQSDPEMIRNHCPLLVQLSRREPLPIGLLKAAVRPRGMPLNLGPGPFLRRRPHRLSPWRKRDLPGSWRTPDYMPRSSTPVYHPQLALHAASGAAIRSENAVGSALRFLSWLYHAAFRLPVYASQ